MRQDSIEVIVVSAENLPKNIQDDFGLIGDIAVSTFARHSDLNRELQVSFKEDDIKKAEEDWKTLVQKTDPGIFEIEKQIQELEKKYYRECYGEESQWLLLWLRSAQVMAAMRALESRRSDRLFDDFLAAKLADDDVVSITQPDDDRPYVPIRTRFFDDFLMSLSEMSDIRQVVIFGVGMDARAFRLSWPSGTVIYELDEPIVFNIKEKQLQGNQPNCKRKVIPIDITRFSSSELLANENFKSYQAERPSVWLLEGVLMYLDALEVNNLLKTISELAAPGSWLGADAINEKARQETEAGWRFGCDDPEELLKNHGWKAKVIQPGDEGAHFGRYTQRLPPREVPEVKRVFLITAQKEEDTKALKLS